MAHKVNRSGIQPVPQNSNDFKAHASDAIVSGHCMGCPHTIVTGHCMGCPHTIVTGHCMDRAHTIVAGHCMDHSHQHWQKLLKEKKPSARSQSVYTSHGVHGACSNVVGRSNQQWCARTKHARSSKARACVLILASSSVDQDAVHPGGHSLASLLPLREAAAT
eukprot:362227-Chlamydomonas_euryale.AAC.3